MKCGVRVQVVGRMLSLQLKLKVILLHLGEGVRALQRSSARAPGSLILPPFRMTCVRASVRTHLFRGVSRCFQSDPSRPTDGIAGDVCGDGIYACRCINHVTISTTTTTNTTITSSCPGRAP